MKYALGNMLNGAGGLNPDGLSLDLQFALDKTLTARKGPTPTFTRASTATFVGSNGLIQSAAINAARFDHDPITLACKGLLIEEARTNLVFPSDTLTTQTRTVTAIAHTLSFYGTGTVVLSGAAIATVTGTGAYPTRTTLTFTPTAGSLILTVTGSVTQAQLETGSFATSYIPTTTAALTRSADICSITGADFTGFYNQPEGTMIIHGDSAGSNGSRWCATGPTRAFEILGKTTISYFESSGGTVNSIGSISLPTKFGLACKLNDFQGVRNGTLGGVDAIATMPSPTALNIGSLLAPSDWLNGCIISLRYYKKRLPNAKLTQLTT